MGQVSAQPCSTVGEQPFPAVLISCLPSEGGGCNKALCFSSLKAVPGSERWAKRDKLWVFWQFPRDVFWQQHSQEEPIGRTRARRITNLKGMRLMQTLWGTMRLLSTSRSDYLSTRNLCLLFPAGFFISREMKTSQNSKCQKHQCRVCAIIMLLRKLLKVLHSPMIYFAVRSTLWDLFISNKNTTEKKIRYFL